MKKMIQLIICALLLGACSSLNKMTNEAFYHAVVGQTEKVVYARVGSPSNTYSEPEGEKILVYAIPIKGMYTYANTSKIKIGPQYNVKSGRQNYNVEIDESVNTSTNAPQYQVYQTNMTYLKIYLDRQGTCTKFEQNLMKPQLEYYYDRLKKYVPEK